METKFYEFSQNNSGGSFDVDENVCHRVIIEAKNENEAIEKFTPMTDNQSGSCPCCGERWYISPSEIDLNYYAKNGYKASIYTHYKDYEARWLAMYGKFKRNEEPKLKKDMFEVFETQVFFESVEDYCQFMANTYGWTTPDIRIHYLNGSKLDIFKQGIDQQQ